VVPLVVAAFTVSWNTSGEARPGDLTVVAMIVDTHGKEIGEAHVVTAEDGRTQISVSAAELTPGFHGFHIHETGKCDPDAVNPETGEPAPFATAGGHYNSTGEHHGSHAGDLPSLLVGDAAQGQMLVLHDSFTPAELLEGDGAAVVIHSDPDNFARIPDRYAVNGHHGPDEDTLATGDAGSRAACGVFEKL
jgi:Cu-Zn family superoxide dismutase